MTGDIIIHYVVGPDTFLKKHLTDHECRCGAEGDFDLMKETAYDNNRRSLFFDIRSGLHWKERMIHNGTRQKP